LFLQSEEPGQEGIEARIARAIEPTLAHLGYELVRVLITGRERPTVQVMADRADGAPFRIEDCEAIHHPVSAILDVNDPFRGAWTLEVSSPGIDRPLTRTKDWVNHVGQLATVDLALPLDGRRRCRGLILGADDAAARLRLEDGSELTIPRAAMRRAKLVLTDALIAATAAHHVKEGN
jgi:ribosome maturation factor RimP